MPRKRQDHRVRSAKLSITHISGEVDDSGEVGVHGPNGMGPAESGIAGVRMSTDSERLWYALWTAVARPGGYRGHPFESFPRLLSRSRTSDARCQLESISAGMDWGLCRSPFRATTCWNRKQRFVHSKTGWKSRALCRCRLDREQRRENLEPSQLCSPISITEGFRRRCIRVRLQARCGGGMS